MGFILWATKENPLIGLLFGLFFFAVLFLLKVVIMRFYVRNTENK